LYPYSRALTLDASRDLWARFSFKQQTTPRPPAPLAPVLLNHLSMTVQKEAFEKY
jgi:hypothetical protein